jgi:hypothetical protein
LNTTEPNHPYSAFSLPQGYAILLVALYEGGFYPTRLSTLRSTFSHPQEDIFIVLMAVDTRVVSEAIRLHYEKVQNPDLPREYLEKIVQIPLPVPRADSEWVGIYVDTLVQVESQIVETESSTSHDEKKKDDVEVASEEVKPPAVEPPTKTDLVVPTRVPHLPDTNIERSMLVRLSADLLDSNPRRIKRLLNTYRYMRYLAHKRGESIHEQV